MNFIESAGASGYAAGMFLATTNRLRQLLCLSYIDEVRPEELIQGLDEVRQLLAELRPGFCVLVDLSQLNAMAVECLTEVGAMMELFDRSGVGLVVRVIPDERKDIGFNILTVFHYPHHPQIITCQNLTEAGRRLAN